MPSFRAQGVLAISCVATLTLPIAFYAIRHRVWKTRETHKGDNFASLPIDQWTTAHVEKWLHTLGVSDEAVAAFVRNEMDGPALLLCEDSHLQTLSLKLRDFLLVRDGLKQLRTEKITPPVEAELPAHVASRAPSQRGAPPAAAMSSARSPHSHEAAAEQSRGMESHLSNEEQLVKEFLDETSAIHTMLSAQKFREASEAVQNGVRAECADRLNRILPLLSGMPPQLRATLLPLANKLNTLIHEQPDAPNAITEQIDTLHKMVDSFLRLLDTAGEGLTTDPQLATLRQRIGGQIREVMAVAASLPPLYGEPLRRKCALVLERVAAVTPAARADGGAIAVNRNDAATSIALPAGPAGAHGTDQMAAAVGRLREIFSSLRSADIVRMKPEARLERVGALLREVRALESGAAAWGDRPGAEVIRQVSSTVEGVLLQMESVTREELSAAQHRQAAGSKQRQAAVVAAAQAVPEPEAPRTGKAALEEIVASLKAATQMVKSEEFAGASAGVQIRVAQHIQRNLRDARSRVARMPLDEATASVAEMINRTLSVIDTVAGEGDEEDEEEDYEVATDSVPAAAAHRVGSRATDTTEGNPAAAAANPFHSTPIEATVAELEEMFGLLNSDSFAALPQAERAEAAAEMLRRLEGIEQRIERLGGDSAAELRELIKPLAEILRLEAGAAPTPLFRGLLAGIKQIEELVTSEGFNTATAERRRAVARTIIPEMMRISDALPRLPPYERAEIQRMMETINKALQDVANGGGSAARDQATSTEARNDRVEDIAMRIEAILSFMQSATFERSPLAVRGALAQELVGRLDAMDAECLALGGEAMSMLPVVRRLREDFTSFASALNTAVEEGTSNNNDTNELNEEGEGKEEEEEEEEEKNGEEEEEEGDGEGIVSDERRAATFEAVARLSRALRGKEHISPSEVDTLRRCISLIDSLGCRTPEEQLQRAELASLLEREVTNPQAQGSLRIESILANAVAEFARHPPRTEAQLRPYVEILTRTQENIDGLSGSALSALSTLRTEVLNKLRAMQNGRPTNNHRNDDSENNLNRNDNNNDENPGEDSENANSHIAGMLLDISNRLRDGPLPEVILGQFEDLLDRAEALGGDPTRAEAIALIREQINLQRISNGSVETQHSEEYEENENEVYSEENDGTDEEKNNGENEENEEEEEEEDNGENEENEEKEEEADNGENEENEEEEKNNEESAAAPGSDGPAAESVESLRSLPDEGVPGAELCALLQLPRIERRLASESPPLTPFDVQCMSAVILSLNTAERVRTRPELRQRVNLAKLALARRIEEAADSAFAAAPRAAVECVVVGAGRVVLRVAGEPCGGDQCVGLPLESTTAECISPECMASWVGRSTALFVCGDDAAGATSRGELALLHDLLVSRYAFDVVTVPAARAAETRRLIAAAAADGAARLFVLYRAAAAAAAMGGGDEALDACEFADGSRLSHAEVVAAAAAVDRVVVARVEPFRLSVLPARRGAAGPALTAAATAAAQGALRPGRCWLFDGLFAPAIAEVLARADGAPVSPAGLVAGPAAAIAGLREVKGAGDAGLSVAGDEAATMAFFVPFDTDGVEAK